MKYFIAIMLTLILVGQGCFGGSSNNVADGAVWSSTDFGESWNHLKTLPQISGVGSIAGTNALDLEIDPVNGEVYYLATAANGFFYSLDAGISWERPLDDNMRAGAIRDIEVDPKNTCTVYALKGRGLYRSTDCARTFRLMYTDPVGENVLTSIAVDWFNPQVVWMGNSSGSILKSINGGANWTTMENGGSAVLDIEISNADSRVVYVGTESRGFFRTDDGGQNWLTYRSGLNKEFPSSSTFYSFAQNEDGSVVLMNTKYGLLRSTDAGLNWEGVNIVTAPSEVRIWDVEIDPKNKNLMYYTTYGSLFISEDGGVSWANRPLPSRRAAIDLQVHPENPRLILAAFRTIES